MNKIIYTAILACASLLAAAQVSTVSNNKPLAFLNPAIQNYDVDKGVLSASYNINPLTLEDNPASFLALAEFELKDGFRLGMHASQYENRLSKSTSVMAYGSYRLELEKGNYLILGADIGGYSETTNSTEYNKVLSPNAFFYDSDSSVLGTSSGLDFGLGISYMYSGFTFGIGFSKLNNPSVYPFPEVQYKVVIVDSVRTAAKKDTTIFLEEGTFGLESNVNLVYEWNASQKVKVTHYLHFGNIDLAGFDYASFQTIAEINKRHSIGAGAFYNGDLGYMATAVYGISEDVKLGASVFLMEDLNYDLVEQAYVSDGLKPMFEFNLRYEF